MAHRNVRADQVQAGHCIWWGVGNARWTRVLSVRRSSCEKYVVLKTLAGETWKHPAEGVAIEDLDVVERRVRDLASLEEKR